MLKKVLPFIVLLLSTLCGMGQTALSGDFNFPDGVYLSHTSVLAVQPDLGWEAIDGEMVQLPEEYTVQIGGYGYKDQSLDRDLMPYAISLDGELYLFVHRSAARDYYEFSGLRIAGTLSTIAFDTVVVKRQLMKAYNPKNGYAFREAWIEREKTVSLTKVLHFPTGQLRNLTRPNLLPLLAEDEELTKALKELPDPTVEYLTRAVKLFDERYPTLLRD